MKTHNQAQEIIGLARKMPDFFTPSALETMKHDIQAGEVVTIHKDQKLVGFVIYSLEQDICEIHWMGVDESFRSQGIGRKLIQLLKSQLRKSNAKTIKVLTLAPSKDEGDYDRTRRFYETQGFSLHKIHLNFPGWDPGNAAAEYRLGIK